MYTVQCTVRVGITITDKLVFVCSIEIPWDDVERIVRKIGFKLEEVNDIHDVPYIQNKNSMLKVCYDCKFFIATKPKF